MNVCVLGAGIVGLATAYELHQHGFNVTVIDQAQTVGSGTSRANGAQLSYSYVQPLANPAIWWQLPQLFLAPNSPFKFRPQLDPEQWRWGLNFLRACNASTANQTTATLLTLAAQSKLGLETMLKKERIDCSYANSGKLVLYPTDRSFAAAQKQIALQQQFGGNAQEAVSALRAQVIEPALARTHNRIAGAIYTPSEAAIDCFLLCQALERTLRANGVRFVLQAKVNKFELKRQHIAAAHTSAGSVVADQFILALGADSAAVASSLGLTLMMYPIKGYSITLNLEAACVDAAPHVSVTDIASKTVFARVGQQLRVAGMAELVGYDRSVRASAIQQLNNRTDLLLPELRDCSRTEPWAGLRPATPTGIPIVGVQKNGPANLHINTGHGALGLTLAFGTARQIARALLAQNKA